MKGLRMPKPTLTKNKDKPNLFFILECDHQIFFHSQITKRKIKLDFSNKMTINMPTDFVNKNINRYSINTCNKYSLRPTFFVLFEKSNFLREHHLLFCLPFKNV